ncbi:MAG: Ig-like domain-containing protein [Bacteroidota bacterium]
MPRTAAVLLLAALAGCATPVAPTGGPPDTTPPTLVEAAPADGAVRVTEPTVRLAFSERLDPASTSAVEVVPEADTPPEIRVRGRDLEITLPELRDSTTYVITVGTELRDQRRVALTSPITVAFATGPTIDRGRLGGEVLDPETGAGVSGQKVWAYALADTTVLPDVREAAPDYRTETGAGGRFTLDYLRPGRYFVVAVADRNRNARVDAGEAFAAPPEVALVAGDDSTAQAPEVRFWTTALDTIPPEARRVQTVSNRRFGVRFSEAVRLLSPGVPIALADSASGQAVEARVYQPPADPFVVFLETPAPLPPRRHLATYAGESEASLADSSGLAPLPFSLAFTPPERPDTTVARFLGVIPEADSVVMLAPGQRPALRFAAPPADLAARVTSPAGAVFDTDDGVTYRLRLDGLSEVFELAVRDGDSTFMRRVEQLGDDQTGGLVGTVEADSGAVFVEVRPEVEGDAVTASVGADGTFAVSGLAPGIYLVRVVGDRNGNGRWDGGALVPYAPPEPLRILPEAVTVRARWDTEIDPVDLRE